LPLLKLFRLLAFPALALLAPQPVQADSLYGAYLAARHADLTSDYRAYVEYGTRALAQDPENIQLMSNLLVAQVGLGWFDAALAVAHRLEQKAPQDQVAGMVLLADAIRREDWQNVLDLLARGYSVGELLDGMIAAWAELGAGRMSQAMALFDDLAQSPGSETFVLYHRALALALVGDHESAAEILSGESGPVLQLNYDGITTYAQVLNQLERNADAIEMLDKVLPDIGDAAMQTLRDKLAAGETVPFDAITSPRQAISEAFYAVADSLAGEVDPSVVLLYSRVSEFSDPDSVYALLLSAELLEAMDRHELAVETYGRISRDSRIYPQAALGRAEVLRRWGKVDEAIAELRLLAEAFPENLLVLISLGDILRFEWRYEEASHAYDSAIKLLEGEDPSQWSLYFYRGVTHEREGRWEQAEADFRKALELNPGEARVLNYLGYSFVEMNRNLEEALEMIELAVRNRPNDGYITDSLGWVYYRLGRYEEAVVQMEHAVELLPLDPVVNDHLGDTLWAVGRRLEAKFQWKRALSFITEDTDLNELNPDRIRRKLQVGLDVVLQEEGAPPLKRTDDNG
jgi:tetratricopeptide (TPR) repeat protein